MLSRMQPAPAAYPSTERRATHRMLAYWHALRGARPMPEESEIDPDAPEVAACWDYCFMVQVRDFHKQDFNYTYLGQGIIRAYRDTLNAENPGELASLSANALMREYRDVIARCEPVITEGEHHNMLGKNIKYRQCLLPLGTDRDVHSIFGVMSFRAG